MTKLPLFLYLPIFLFTQDLNNHTLADYNNKAVIDTLIFENKIDTLNYIQSQSSDIVLFYHNNYVKVQKIIQIETDSLKVELLDFKWNQWKTDIKGRDIQKSSLIKYIAIDDIDIVYYKVIKLNQQVLRAITLYSILFYVIFNLF
tara:strand:- start:26 stop:460 length:435 start_codon:yes stop_codon:yes gene_type:complete